MEEGARTYWTLEGSGTGEIEVKKSRFIASLYHVETEREVTSIIEDIRKKYWDSRHNCHGYILGTKGDRVRSSDDGEPAKTAGQPILEVLKGENLTYVLAVVTRYFGGIKLGTGGLARAYGDAVTEGLKNCSIVQKNLCRIYEISLDYQTAWKLKYVLQEEKATIIDEVYTDRVSLKFGAPVEMDGLIERLVCEYTFGQVLINPKDTEVLYL